MSKKKKWSLGLLFTGVAIGVGATIAAVVRQQRREQVYHEAELKAMDELEDLMAEDVSACSECEGIEDCVCPCGSDDFEEGQISITPVEDAPDAPTDETDDDEDLDYPIKP